MLTVLLTGRAEHRFSELLKRILKSKQLNFDILCLKPSVSSHEQSSMTTLAFKQAVISDIVHTYNNAEEVRIYEDRPQQ